MTIGSGVGEERQPGYGKIDQRRGLWDITLCFLQAWAIIWKDISSLQEHSDILRVLFVSSSD